MGIYINYEYEDCNNEENVEIRNNELKIFKNVYKNQIEYISRPILRNISKIIPDYYIINLNINNRENENSKIKIDREIKLRFDIYINLKQMNLILNQNKNKMDINIMDCFNILLTHEYMHILCKHISNKRTLAIHSFMSSKDRNMVLYYDNFVNKYSKHRRSIFFLPRTSDELNFNLDNIKIDYELYNIATDLYINEIINAPYPLLRAKNFNLPRNLKDYEYYAILMYVKYYNNYPNEDYEKVFSINRVKFIANHYSYLKNYFEELNKNNFNNKKLDEERNKDFDRILLENDKYDYDKIISNYLEKEIDNFSKSTLQGKSHDLIEILNNSKNGIWKDFKVVLNSIKKIENDKKLSLNKYKNDWTRFNNRKEDKISSNSGLIYPGRRSVKNKNGNIFNIENNAVVFIDISLSMYSIIEPLYTLCYLLLKQLDIKLVLYDVQICKIYDGFKDLDFNKDNFFIGSGTNVANSILEYQEKYGTIKQLYIISDCYDNTLNSLKEKFGKNIKIFEFRQNSLKERCFNE